MKPKAIKRRVVCVDTSNQLNLFDDQPEAAFDANEAAERTKGSVLFQDPDPRLIRLNAVRLDQHLQQTGAERSTRTTGDRL